MKSIFWFLARKAGFSFWEKEDHKPPNAIIDWACDYDQEMQEYTKEVIIYVTDYISRNITKLDESSKRDVLLDAGFKV